MKQAAFVNAGRSFTDCFELVVGLCAHSSRTGRIDSICLAVLLS